MRLTLLDTPIHVVPGGLDGLGAALGDVVPAGRAMVVTDPNVEAAWAGPCLDSLRRAGFDPVLLRIPAGEATKTIATWHALVEDLIGTGIDRGTPVVALGGGVVGDLAGFAAATALRGLPFAVVPTSLLAMVDAAVGGKTGVDSPHGKNLIGAFHRPVLVWAAMGTLATLPDSEFTGGLGEVVKHGAIGDPELFRICEEQVDEIRARAPGTVAELVERSVGVKAAVVQQDEREAGHRAILNFGHTVGHAVEAAAGFGTFHHGAAVAIGMVAESAWAARSGRCPPEDAARLAAVLHRLGLPTALPALDPERLLAAVGHDKKRTAGGEGARGGAESPPRKGGMLRMPVLEEIGRVRLEELPLQEWPKLFEHPRKELP